MFKRWTVFLLAVLVVILVSAPVYAGVDRSVAAAASQTYAVVVGAEDVKRGVDLEAYFPATLTIHVGDKVHWIQNSNEIHTVTFLAGAHTLPPLIVPAPAGAQSPIMLNPQAGFPTVPPGGMYNGLSYANSGILSMEPGQAREFNLTFTRAGSYDYVCLVHGQMMSGKIVVVDASTAVPSPAQAAAQANNEMVSLWAQVDGVIKDAQKAIKPATQNPDGTLTHYISMGYADGQIDLMRFFPSHIVVHPGDTVEWSLSSTDVAPHTATFMNGNPDYPLAVPQPQPNGPPLLLLNPKVLAPQNPGKPLTRDGVYSSGLMDPTLPGPHTYSLKIGDIDGYIDFDCILHDANGMTGWFIVAPRRN